MSSTLKAEIDVRQGSTFEDLLIRMQKQTHLLLFSDRGRIGWWKSLDEVPNGGYTLANNGCPYGYYILVAEEVDPTCGYKQSFTVVSDEVASRMLN